MVSFFLGVEGHALCGIGGFGVLLFFPSSICNVNISENANINVM